MSRKHLKTNDPFPDLPADDGKLRLLSMRFCPYAQRVQLVLDAKRIPHHVININLTEKPLWLTQYSPQGKVPALGLANQSAGSSFMIESLKIADFLDEEYPEPKLNSDPNWVDGFNEVIGPFFDIVFGGRDDDALTRLLNALDRYENELHQRGDTGFFGHADRPGMLDYMIWPWMERLDAMKWLVGDEESVFDRYEIRSERFPLLTRWKARMLTDSAVQASAFSTGVHVKYYQMRQTYSDRLYDFLLDE